MGEVIDEAPNEALDPISERLAAFARFATGSDVRVFDEMQGTLREIPLPEPATDDSPDPVS